MCNVFFILTFRVNFGLQPLLDFDQSLLSIDVEDFSRVILTGSLMASGDGGTSTGVSEIAAHFLRKRKQVQFLTDRFFSRKVYRPN